MNTVLIIMEPPMKPAIKTANCAKGFIMIFKVYNIIFVLSDSEKFSKFELFWLALG